MTLDDSALEKFASLGSEVSLRYALQLMTPASVLAKVGGRKEIKAVDVEEARELFLDARRSAGVLKGKGGGFVV